MAMEEAWVRLSQIEPHPDNANIGQVDRIVASLKKNGQYRPLVVQKSTSYIIKGNHTYRAVKQLRWKEVQVVYVDVDDRQALQILVADNAASRRSFTDMAAVVDIVADLPTVEGTGYWESEIQMPDMYLEPVPPVLEPEEEEASTPEAPAEKLPAIVVGRVKGTIKPEAYHEWRASVPRNKSEAVERLTELLGVKRKEDATPQNIVGTMDTVAISDLKPWPKNPQQGDTGMVTELLKAHGQYSPVIVNRRTMTILAGHTLTRAAKALGWTELGVNWVDMDPADEAYVVLSDNAAGAFSVYDNEKLGMIMAKLGSVENTGLELEDLAEILNGEQYTQVSNTGKDIKLQVGNLTIKVPYADFKEMGFTQGKELHQLAQRVGIDPDHVML